MLDEIEDKASNLGARSQHMGYLSEEDARRYEKDCEKLQNIKERIIEEFCGKDGSVRVLLKEEK